ncbi:hypothetical protein GQ53DRAFT_740890 [Thozetella sp. PMI_491]|nr:hypothetical protein GQ53DRAFT_740890 [Thozetella sp. PMI_491]
MPTASERAKAKLDAVLNHPGRNDFSGCKNRIGATRHPSTGGCDVVNRVDRRPSQSSQSSETGRIKKMWNNMVNRPAY